MSRAMDQYAQRVEALVFDWLNYWMGIAVAEPSPRSLAMVVGHGRGPWLLATAIAMALAMAMPANRGGHPP